MDSLPVPFVSDEPPPFCATFEDDDDNDDDTTVDLHPPLPSVSPDLQEEDVQPPSMTSSTPSLPPHEHQDQSLASMSLDLVASTSPCPEVEPLSSSSQPADTVETLPPLMSLFPNLDALDGTAAEWVGGNTALELSDTESTPGNDFHEEEDFDFCHDGSSLPPPAPNAADTVDNNWASWTAAPSFTPLQLSQHVDVIVDHLKHHDTPTIFDTFRQRDVVDLDNTQEDEDDRFSRASSDSEFGHETAQHPEQQKKEEEDADEVNNFAAFPAFVQSPDPTEETLTAGANWSAPEQPVELMMEDDDFDDFTDFVEPQITSQPFTPAMQQVHETPADVNNQQLDGGANDLNDGEDEFRGFDEAPSAVASPPAAALVSSISVRLLDRLVDKCDSLMSALYSHNPPLSQDNIDFTLLDNSPTDPASNAEFDAIWTTIEDFEKGRAIKFHWPESQSYKEYLKLLNVDHESLVRSRQPLLPAFASHMSVGGLLEPQKVIEPTIAVRPPAPKVEPVEDVTTRVNDTTFDWANSGLSNPLPSHQEISCAAFLDSRALQASIGKGHVDNWSGLESSLVSSAETSGLSQCFAEESGSISSASGSQHHSIPLSTSSSSVSKLISEVLKPRSSSAAAVSTTSGGIGSNDSNQPAPMSDAAKVILRRLPKITQFMNAKVLMFPLLSDLQQHS